MRLKHLLLGSLLLVSSACFAQLPTASEVASKMYPGWNHGNTMEGNNNGKNFSNDVGLAGETSWQVLRQPRLS